MNVNEIEALIVSLGGEVPEGNKDIKTEVAKNLAVAFLAEHEVTDIDGLSLAKLAEKIELLSQGIQQDDNTGANTQSNNNDHKYVYLHCSVRHSFKGGASVEFGPGKANVPAEVLTDLPNQLYFVIEPAAE